VVRAGLARTALWIVCAPARTFTPRQLNVGRTHRPAPLGPRPGAFLVDADTAGVVPMLWSARTAAVAAEVARSVSTSVDARVGIPRQGYGLGASASQMTLDFDPQTFTGGFCHRPLSIRLRRAIADARAAEEDTC
jgi:hypothetical protein